MTIHVDIPATDRDLVDMIARNSILYAVFQMARRDGWDRETELLSMLKALFTANNALLDELQTCYYEHGPRFSINTTEHIPQDAHQ